MARRPISLFTLSFLDVMSCGLGAVVLFFMVINAQVSTRADRVNQELLAQTDLIEEEILDGRKKLVVLRNSLESEREEQLRAEGEARRLQERIELIEIELAALDQRSMAREESIEDLQADVERLEAAKKRLSAESADPALQTGRRVRSFVGEGNRQYLTGMKMGGRHVLILVDRSASMLGRDYVNVLRFRNMAPEQRREAPKWQQALRTVDWLTTQIAPDAQFQIYAFNDEVSSVLEGTQGQWLEVGDGTLLSRAVDALKGVVPENGTSLYKAFLEIRNLDPRPDNVYLLTDGLPTQSRTAPPTVRDVKASERREFLIQAQKILPGRVPVNIILFPMQGDPDAAGDYWQLAARTGGSFLTPARDWP